VRKLSKKVHKFNEAEQFVFISEQSAHFFVKFSTNNLPHNSIGRPMATELKKKGL
jgi:hypothetical protein